MCQLDSPRSISAAIQRVGRSGHSLGATPKGRLFALTHDDLLECGAAVRAIRHGILDEVEIPTGCLDVAAQQIVAIAADEDEISETDLLSILRSTYTFREFDAAKLTHLLEQMATELPERIMGAAPKLFYDRVNRRVRPRRSARLSAITSGGTIPEAGNYDVVIESEGRKIGDVEEDFAQESSRGDVFSLGSMPWMIRRISRGRLLVEPAPGMAPSLPFWQTEAGGRSPALSGEIANLKHEIVKRMERGDEAAAWLMSECAMSERAAPQAVDYVRRGYLALGTVPDDRNVVIERFFDGLGGTQIVIHSPFGIRFNRGLGLAIRKKLCQSFDFEIQASAIDDGVLLALNSRHSFPLDELFPMVKARNARDTLVQALLAAPMFEVRFRHVASRALTIMRSSRGRKVPAWIQRLRTQEVLSALFPGQQACFENRPPAIPIPEHYIVEETLNECLTESADITRIESTLDGIEQGRVRVTTVDSVAPSVFAHRLLLAWDYSFLDDGERGNRRSRTVSMNRGMAEDVFRSEDLSEMLAAEAVASVTAEVTGLDPARRPRDADELLELIKSHGALTADEIVLRAGERAAAMLDRLREDGRIVSIVRAELPAWIVAAEDNALFNAAYDAEAPGTNEAREELTRRALRTSGPVVAREVAERLRFKESDMASLLAQLEAKGAIFRGHFTRADEIQWCDRYNLERIHRMTLARVRAEIEPCADEEYAAFRLRWMHAGGIDITPDQNGIALVLELLAGMAFTPDEWERSILPARIPGYRPEMLDLVLAGGQYVWIGVTEESRIANTPERVMLVPRGLTLFTPRHEGEPSDPNERAVLAALNTGGAQFLDELSDRADLSERDALAALWRLASNSRVTNDSFAPLRMFAADAETTHVLDSVPRRPPTRRDAAVRARLKSSLAGRWSALRAGASAGDQQDETRELAMLLLERNGILSREMLALETMQLSWSEVSFALRRLEYGGVIRRGWFVRSLSAEQYALPEAVEQLRGVRGLNPARERPLALSAADPANPFGAMLPGCGITREASNIVVLRAGRLAAGLQSRTMVSAGEIDEESFRDAVAAIVAMKRRVTIDTIDGAAALKSPRVGALAAMRFHSDGRALVYDGLPGPMPAGVSRAST